MTRAARVLLALACVAFNVALAATPDDASPSVELPAAVLERYTGFYQLSESTVITVTRAGTQLSVQLTGQPAAAIYPQTAASFRLKVVDARIDFMPNPPADITALVLHQNGIDHVAPRIDAALAQRVAAALTQRMQSQTASPGSEEAARRLLSGVASGSPDYSQMSPALATATRAQMPKLQTLFATLGAVQSLTFQGVGNQGWDVYLVHHEHGLSQLRIHLDADGTVSGALMTAGP